MQKSIFITELNKNLLGDAMQLLEEYGDYMFNELSLAAGKKNFYDELGTSLLDVYKSAFYIAYVDEHPAGCVALKRWDDQSCELKRMFVRSRFRRRGIGNEITKHALEKARMLGYSSVLLDTNKEMDAAVKLYLQLGFQQTEAYVFNENANALYFIKYL